jgi:hypothetical protein
MVHGADLSTSVVGVHLDAADLDAEVGVCLLHACPSVMEKEKAWVKVLKTLLNHFRNERCLVVKPHFLREKVSPRFIENKASKAFTTLAFRRARHRINDLKVHRFIQTVLIRNRLRTQLNHIAGVLQRLRSRCW